MIDEKTQAAIDALTDAFREAETSHLRLEAEMQRIFELVGDRRLIFRGQLERLLATVNRLLLLRTLESEPVKLTPRESDVLKGLLMNRSYKEIAVGLGIEVRTVKFFIARLFEKHRVHSREELLAQLRDRQTSIPEVR